MLGRAKNYTPATSEVRSAYGNADEFNRWLNSLKAEVWDEGAEHVANQMPSFFVWGQKNPYRETNGGEQ